MEIAMRLGKHVDMPSSMDPIGETLDEFEKPAQFMHLQNFAELHRANRNRVFVDFEANP